MHQLLSMQYFQINDKAISTPHDIEKMQAGHNCKFSQHINKVAL